MDLARAAGNVAGPHVNRSARDLHYRLHLSRRGRAGQVTGVVEPDTGVDREVSANRKSLARGHGSGERGGSTLG